MKRNVVICALAGATLAATSPALAKPGGGGGGGNAGASVGANVGGGVGVGRGAVGTVGSGIDTAIQAGRGGVSIGATGQGSANANARAGFGSAIDMRGSTSARTRASRDTTVGTSTRLGTQVNAQAGAQLTGVVDGMTVVDSGGLTIGTVTGIHTVGNGRIRSVQVTLTDGTIINLSPGSLSVDGDVLATTSLTTNVKSQGAAHANINGLVHASPNSALASAGVTTLTGLTTGLTVEGTGGASLGTVSQVFVNSSGAVVGIRVALDGGGTVVIPATTLTMDGTTVVTTFVPGG
jgi:hypothetical protein